MTVSDLLARALSQAGNETEYVLGGGRQTPDGGDCRDENGGSDCSAFVCWALGIPKAAPFAWMRRVNGGWYNTDGIWWDALHERTGLFSVCKPAVGAVVVYPSSWMSRRHAGVKGLAPKIGHVGIVTEVRAGEISRVLHCSAGNFRRTGDAIQETGPEVFRAPAVATAWCATITEGV